GSTHNSLEDLSLMASLPNMNILIPSDNIELIEILEYVFSHQAPFYVRLPRGAFPKIHESKYKFKISKPDILKEGNDICLIGTGYGSTLALNSANLIEEQLKISIKVINFPTVKPIDEKSLLEEIKTVEGILIIEEHNIYCGFGSIIARILSEKYPKTIKFMGINNSFGESGKREELLNSYGLTKAKIIEQIKKII
ncbi:MAG: transketolase family protein, partial [Candidatus Thorarchaeota archaeon]